MAENPTSYQLTTPIGTYTVGVNNDLYRLMQRSGREGGARMFGIDWRYYCGVGITAGQLVIERNADVSSSIRLILRYE